MAQTSASTIRVRGSRATLLLIERAAKVLGCSRSTFMLEVAVERATEILLDRKHFELNASDHGRFVKALDQPLPKESAASVQRLLKRKAPWEH